MAAILSGLLGFGLGPKYGPRVAAAAIPVGFLVSCWATIGWPAFPPVSSNQKIVYVALIGTIAGVIFVFLGRNQLLNRIGPALWSGMVICWLGWRTLTAPSLTGLALLGGLWLAGMTIIIGLRSQRSEGIAPGVMLLIAACGVSLIALIGSSASFAQLSGGLAAATGGFLLWNWPKDRFPFGWVGQLGGAGALLSLVTAMALFTSASKLAILLILPVFFADRLAARLPLSSHPVLAPFALAMVCLVPVAIAVLVAYQSSGGESGYAFNMEVSR